MNLQPYRTPPRWWSSRFSRIWVRMSRPLRRGRGYLEHGLRGVDVRGLEHVRQAMQAEHGVLIAPNHPSHADPYAVLEAADQLHVPFHFMTAWQVFAMTHRIGRQALRGYGCFSVNREGNDLRAVRHAIRLLEQNSNPLVIFPEGEVYHLNDQVMPLRKGAVSAAVLAARRSGRPVSIVPSALNFTYVDDPTQQLSQAMTRLENAIGMPTADHQSLVNRIARFADRVVSEKEVEHLGWPQTGSLQCRINNLVEGILSSMAERYAVMQTTRTVPERIKQLRQRAIDVLESRPEGHVEARQAQQTLQELFFATQLYSYPVNYLAGNPSIDRVAETIDKLEEDVLRVARAPVRGTRRAVVSFGAPLVVQPHFKRRQVVEELTIRLRCQIQDLVDEINLQQRPQRTVSQPAAHWSDSYLSQTVPA